MFFLRCVFWLSVVYSSMTWTNGALRAEAPGAPVLALGRTVVTRLADTAVSGATDLCARHAAECLTDAARLTSLFVSTDPLREPDSDSTGLEDYRDVVPLPVPDPRRRVGGTKLAHTS